MCSTPSGQSQNSHCFEQYSGSLNTFTADFWTLQARAAGFQSGNKLRKCRLVKSDCYLICQPLASGAYKNTFKKSKGSALLQEEQAVFSIVVHKKKNKK